MSAPEDDQSENLDEEELDGMDIDDGEEELDVNYEDDSDEESECYASDEKNNESGLVPDVKDSSSNDAGKQNPEYLELLSLWGNGKFDTVRFVGKDGKTVVYDFTD